MLAAVVADARPGAVQSPTKPALIARLAPGSAADPAQIAFLDAFREGMRGLGHVEGRSYRIEPRYAEGDAARLPALAAEIVGHGPDVIVASGTIAVRAAKDATAAIPIVMAMSGPDPVRAGLVASLARPGANVTGFTGQLEDLQGKQLELLREIVPGLTRVAALHSPYSANVAPRLDRIAHIAAMLGVQATPSVVAQAGDLESAFAAMAEAGVGGVVVLPDPPVMDRLRVQVADLAVRHRLPLAASFRMNAEAGGLVSYSENLEDMHRRSAIFVDKILKGAKPADLPVEQPTKFELVVNLKTAKALGIAIPQSILLRADEVIE
jgi:putative ABC transport system substrate-binding protein